MRQTVPQRQKDAVRACLERLHLPKDSVTTAHTQLRPVQICHPHTPKGKKQIRNKS